MKQTVLTDALGKFDWPPEVLQSDAVKTALAAAQERFRTLAAQARAKASGAVLVPSVLNEDWQTTGIAEVLCRLSAELWPAKESTGYPSLQEIMPDEVQTELVKLEEALQAELLRYEELWEAATGEKPPRLFEANTTSDLDKVTAWWQERAALAGIDGNTILQEPVPPTRFGPIIRGKLRLLKLQESSLAEAFRKHPQKLLEVWPDDGKATATQLASWFQVPENALRKRLEHRRSEDHGCYRELADSGRREPKFEYMVGRAKDIIRDLQLKQTSRETADKRPTKKTSS